jgi:hypothetical protein
MSPGRSSTASTTRSAGRGADGQLVELALDGGHFRLRGRPPLDRLLDLLGPVSFLPQRQARLGLGQRCAGLGDLLLTRPLPQQRQVLFGHLLLGLGGLEFTVGLVDLGL